MALFAIADLHLSFSTDKPMDIFGDHWANYEEKIKESWMANIGQEDTVLIPGDISWAIRMDQAKADLDWIHDLPGHKILLRGNHDYWWTSLTKMQPLYPDIDFLQNNFYTYKDYAICGTRGWMSPNPTKFDDQDEKIHARELIRLKLSLDQAKKAGHDKIIVMTHYPPTNDRLDHSAFMDVYEEYGVERVIYGHLHTKSSFKTGLQGLVNGVLYQLTSCDFLGFEPLRIME